MTEQRKFNTSEEGRKYVADFFSSVLQRHDFTRYINESLAADFACALASGLHDMLAAQPAPQRVAVPDEDMVREIIRESMLDVIRRLNQNPYSLTKQECISEIRAMLSAAPARPHQPDGGGDDSAADFANRLEGALQNDDGEYLSLHRDFLSDCAKHMRALLAKGV